MRRASPSSTTTAISRRRMSPPTGSSAISSKSGWRATTTSGARCGPTASTERYCTGDAAPQEKFLAWARTVPQTLRNPLYHWTHLELKRYFGIDELLDESSAPRIWEQANAMLATDDLRAHGILGKFHVKAVCTTDDPTDDLSCHKAIAASGLPTKVFPTFRPDKALTVHLPEVFNPWVERLAAAANIEHRRLSLISWMRSGSGTTISTRWVGGSPTTA